MPSRHFGLVDPLLTREDVVYVTRIAPVEAAGTKRPRVAQWNVDRASHVIAQVIAMADAADANLDAPAEFVRRRIERDELEKPADAAGAVQRALRPTKHLHVRKIARIDIRNGEATTVVRGSPIGHVVDGDTHCRIPGTCRQTANGQELNDLAARRKTQAGDTTEVVLQPDLIALHQRL